MSCEVLMRCLDVWGATEKCRYYEPAMKRDGSGERGSRGAMACEHAEMGEIRICTNEKTVRRIRLHGCRFRSYRAEPHDAAKPDVLIETVKLHPTKITVTAAEAA